MGCKVRMIISRDKLYRKNYNRDGYEVITSQTVYDKEICQLMCELIRLKKEYDNDDE